MITALIILSLLSLITGRKISLGKRDKADCKK